MSDVPDEEFDLVTEEIPAPAQQIREAAVVMASSAQEPLDTAAPTRWASGFGIGLTLFRGWPDFVDQALFWSGEPKPEAANRAIRFIHQRLVAVEASPAAVALWQSLVRLT